MTEVRRSGRFDDAGAQAGTPERKRKPGAARIATYDPVLEAGLESFPCSDPPAWAGFKEPASRKATRSGSRRKIRGLDPESPNGEDLQVPVRTVCYIAERAHDLMGKSASTEAEDAPDEEDAVADILEDRGHDAVEEEPRSVIDDLDEIAQRDLVALLWLGRDDDEWNVLRDLAWQERTSSPASYLLGTPFLADYLFAGLEKLGLECPTS